MRLIFRAKSGPGLRSMRRMRVTVDGLTPSSTANAAALMPFTLK